MAEEVSVDTDLMSGILPRLTALADRTRGARGGLVSRLAPFNSAAGVDDAGAKVFCENYTPAKDQIIGAILDFFNIVGGIALGIHTMIIGYNTTEENNTLPGFGDGQGGSDHGTTPTEKPPSEKP